MVVGPSGGGKSTCAASWLNNAMPIMGDDMICVSNCKCYPIKREFHIGEEGIAQFTQLRDTNDLIPYMPGYQKLEYDWLNRYPELVMEAANFPSLIVVTSVSHETKTTYDIIKDNDVKQSVIRENASAYNESSLKEFFEKIHDVPFVRVAWGTDIWQYPRTQFGYLQDLYTKLKFVK